MTYSENMKATEHHLNRMVRRHGSYSATARALGLDPRCLRRTRRASDTPTGRLIVLAGKLLAIREMVRHLRATGVLPDARIREAWEATSRPKQPTRKPRHCTTSVSARRRSHNAR